MRALGVPAPLARPLALLLPMIESALAVALVALPHSSWPAWASLLLLGAFTVVVVMTIGRGVPCPCFGASTAPTGPPTVVRNLVLLAVSVLATGPADGARAAHVAAWVVALGAVVVASIVGSGRSRIR